MDRPWFDQETDVLLIDEYIVEMDSYKRIVEDGKITDTELLEQTLRVVTLLRRLEEALSPEAKALATEALGLTPEDGQTRVSDTGSVEGGPKDAGSNTTLYTRVQSRGGEVGPLLTG